MANGDEFDLWADEPLPDHVLTLAQTSPPREDENTSAPPVAPNFTTHALLRIQENQIELFSKSKISSTSDLTAIYGLEEFTLENCYCYRALLRPLNAYIFRHGLRGVELTIDPRDAQELALHANQVPLPRATIASTGKHIEVTMPYIRVYQDLMKRVGGYPVKNGYRVSLGRVLDLEALIANGSSKLPRIELDEEVLKLSREPIGGFDGTLESLKMIQVGELNLINSNLQQVRHLKNNGKTLAEKFNEFGIENLYDLLFTLPRRFIDKSHPQSIEDLIEGESATVVGKIVKTGEMPNAMGVYFLVGNDEGDTVKVTFWRQQWLRAKFNEGEEVLVTGKVVRFRGHIELSGSSIEHSEEAAVLPIVPIYKQSETRGITTQIIMASLRELLSRAGKIQLPAYLRQDRNLTYAQALTELHFPTSLEQFRRACDDLAYYELVYMQLLMQRERSMHEKQTGIAMEGGGHLQETALTHLPFSLTNSQKQALKTFNDLLGSPSPAQTLLNAEVGSGKTVVAQLACLRAVDSGYQAVLIGPTEILARQLHATLLRLKETLDVQGQSLRVDFLGAGIKAKEKKEILTRIGAGEVDIVVGTVATMAEAVKYKNLGLVCVDEQQKFGAEQRTRLLHSREDGRVPDLLMMSATPIPRSTAQIFYGDMTMVELTEKPPGRLPIVTEWIQENPIDFASQLANYVWSDVQVEANKGNQTFVITPLVQDSDRVDAASVERTYKSLTEGTLKGLSVAYVHGRQKKEEQQQIMSDFRQRRYDVLVASTVVEVGVDIPDATRVVILSADRLGAASLHQIRGRVGRNDRASKCYLVSEGKTLSSQIRLQSLVDSENGFDIAMADLELRGEGRMFSTEQSGSSDMIFASLARHRDWIAQATADAKQILASSHRERALTDAQSRYNATERLF